MMETGSLNNKRTWMWGVSKPNDTETSCTSPCLGAAVTKNGYRAFGGFLRNHRSRSSPVRSGISSANSPVRRARSPSTSALQCPIPPASEQSLPAPHATLYNHKTNALGAVAFYAPHPPSTPIYLVPLVANPESSTAQIFDSSKLQQKRMKMKDSKRVVRHILQSILRAVAVAITARTASHGSAGFASSGCTPMKSKEYRLYRSIASQTKPISPTRRDNAKIDVDDLSSSSAECCHERDEGCEWAGDVRALRDSHVRIVLRQLQQLQEIERLNRTLRRAQVIPTARPVNHLEASLNPEPACLQ